MPSAVEVLFASRGLPELLAGIGTVEKSLEKLSRSGQSAAQRSVDARVKGEQSVAKAAEKAARETAKAQEKAAADGAKAKQRTLDGEAKAVAQAERNKTREVEKAEAERLRIREKNNALELRLIKEEERAQSVSMQRRARESESRARTFGRVGGNAIGHVTGYVGRAAAVVGALGAGFSLADSLQSGVRQEKTAGVIFRGASNVGDFKSQGEVASLARQTAIKTGGTTDDTLAGLDQFVRKTGDLGVAKAMLEDMAKLSAATGTNFEDMGSTTAEVYNQLNDSAKTMEVMRALAAQGKAGAIDIKDLGQYGGRLASSAAMYSGSLSTNIESFGAVAQLAKKLGGATDAAEATQAVVSLGADVTHGRHAKALQEIGVDVYSDKSRTKLRSQEDIITDAVTHSKGDLSILTRAFGEQSIKAVRGAQVVYANAGGGAAGEAAIRKQFADMKSSTLSADDVDVSVKQRLAETDAKVNGAMDQLHAVINERLLPKLPELIDKLVQLIPVIQKVIDFFLDHSFTADLGLVIGAAFAAEIGKAALGAILQKGLTAAFSGVTGLLAGGGGAAAAGGSGTAAAGILGGGALATGGIVLAIAAVAGALYYAGTKIVDAVNDAMKSAEDQIRADLIGGGNATSKLKTDLRTGRVERADIDDAGAKLRSITSDIGSGEAEKSKSWFAGGTVNGLISAGANAITGGAVGTSLSDQAKSAEAAKNLDALKQQAAELTRTLQLATEAAQTFANVPPPPGGGGAADPNSPGRGGVQ